jgi:hypothetical protein
MCGAVATVVACTPPSETASLCPEPGSLVGDAEGLMAHVRYLADDALEGRGLASRGERCAAEYVAAQFDAAGLEPAGDSATWMQGFQVRVGSRLGEDNALIVGGEGLALGADWAPWGFSASGRIEGALVYTGSGLSRDASGAVRQDDRPAVSGRIAVVEIATEGSPDWSFQSDPHFKAAVAQGREATGVILLLDEGETLPSLERERRPFIGVPVVAAAGAAAEFVRAAAQAGESAAIQTGVEAVMGEALNVVALLPGSDPERADEVVVVGAHYDHLGHGGEGSFAPDVHDIHNGADDNASGTATLIEVARALAAGPAPARPVVFIAFSGEEMGLLGSAHFVREPTVTLDDAVAMLNMDMIGRLRDNTLTVFGMATAPEWEPLIEDVNAAQPSAFELALRPSGLGPSDHRSFFQVGIPALHFFTDRHSDYHRPEDDWEALDAAGLERITRFVRDVTAAVAGAGMPAWLVTPVEKLPAAHSTESPT